MAGMRQTAGFVLTFWGFSIGGSNFSYEISYKSISRRSRLASSQQPCIRRCPFRKYINASPLVCGSWKGWATLWSAS